MNHRSFSSIMISVIVSTSFAAARSPSSANSNSPVRFEEKELQPIPCGIASIYVLCRLEGVKVDLSAFGSLLRVNPAAGHSMLELRKAAHIGGLELEGVKLGKADWPLDRPALIHIIRNAKGHYVVIRKVGHSDKLVQMIDTIHGVEVKDFDRLVSSPAWTGLALVPRRPNWTARILAGLSGLAAVGLLLAWLTPRWKLRRGVAKRSRSLNGTLSG